jgi:hypothetical protein
MRTELASHHETGSGLHYARRHRGPNEHALLVSVPRSRVSWRKAGPHTKWARIEKGPARVFLAERGAVPAARRHMQALPWGKGACEAYH